MVFSFSPGYDYSRINHFRTDIQKMIDQIHRIFDGANIDEMNACYQYMINVSKGIESYGGLFEEMAKKFQEVFDNYYHSPESMSYLDGNKFD